MPGSIDGVNNGHYITLAYKPQRPLLLIDTVESYVKA